MLSVKSLPSSRVSATLILIPKIGKGLSMRKRDVVGLEGTGVGCVG